jgi:hypothetical protein
MVAKRSRAGKSNWAGSGRSEPARLAVTVEQAAEALNITVEQARLLARDVQPYQAADGTERWPLRELSRVLAGGGRVVGRSGPP